MKGLAYLLGRSTGICLLIIAAYLIISKLNNQTKHQKFNVKPTEEEATTKYQSKKQTTRHIEYKNSYEPKYLMTLNEKAQFKKLQAWTQGRGLIIFSKVRLLDLITPRKGQGNYKSLLWKIQAKHVDFVICDKDIRIKCIIEINDNSHKQANRYQRDQFVVEVLAACGYKVLQTYNVTNEQLDQICGFNQSTPG